MPDGGHHVETILRMKKEEGKEFDYFDPECEGLTAQKLEEALIKINLPYSRSDLDL